MVQDRRASGKEWWQSSDEVLQSLPPAYSRAVAHMEAAIQAAGMMIKEGHSGESRNMVREHACAHGRPHPWFRVECDRAHNACSQIENLHRVVAAHPFPRRVCEIGVNAGHSAAVWMTARPDVGTELCVG